MNKIAVALALASMCTLAAGCSDGNVARMVELEEIKAAAYEKAGDDCNKIAQALEEFNGKYGAEHKELMKNLDAKYKGDKAAGEKAMEPYKDRIAKNKKVIIGAVFKCSDNEAYSKAMKAGSAQ
jgi:hypothetical protein